MRLRLLIILLAGCMTLQTHGMLDIMAYKIIKQIVEHVKNHTAPIHFVGVYGNVYQSYSVIDTTITIPPNKEQPPQGQLAQGIKIQRAYRGSINPGNKFCLLPDRFQLKVPSVPIDLNAATAGLPEMMTKVAGAADPQIGALVGAVSALGEMGMEIASEEISDALGEQETDLTMLEILPDKYYHVNTEKNTIELKKQFMDDIPAFNRAYQKFVVVARDYNALLKDYNYRIQKLKSKYKYELPAAGLPPEDQQEYDALERMKKEQIASKMKEALTAMLPLQQYGMHRITIMGAYAKPGNACSAPYAGPLFLYIYYFLGAKLTNLIKVPYCIKNGADPDLTIHIWPDDIDRVKGTFKQGGVQLVATDLQGRPVLSLNNTTIAFPGQTAPRISTDVYSWWIEPFTSSDDYGSSVMSYMLPYDIFNTEKLKNEIKQAKWKAAVDSANQLLDLSVQYFKQGGQGEKDLGKAAPAPSGDGKEAGGGSDIMGKGKDILGQGVNLLTGLLGKKKDTTGKEPEKAVSPSEGF